MMHRRLVVYVHGLPHSCGTFYCLDGATVGLIVAGPIVESALLSVAACLFVLFLVKSTTPVKNVLRKRGAERSSLHLK